MALLPLPLNAISCLDNLQVPIAVSLSFTCATDLQGYAIQRNFSGKVKGLSVWVSTIQFKFLLSSAAPGHSKVVLLSRISSTKWNYNIIYYPLPLRFLCGWWFNKNSHPSLHFCFQETCWWSWSSPCRVVCEAQRTSSWPIWRSPISASVSFVWCRTCRSISFPGN